MAAYPWLTGYALVAIGGALGSMARFWMGDMVARLAGPGFPWGTLLINVVGSFVIGWFDILASEFGPVPMPAHARAFVMVGICGGFTTFSAFSLQTLQLAQGGEMLRAGAYVLASVALCLLSVWAGAALARA